MKHESVDEEMEEDIVKTEDMGEAEKEAEVAESGKDVTTPAENGEKPDSVEAPLPLRMNLRERSVAAFQSLKSKPVDGLGKNWRLYGFYSVADPDPY